MTPASRLPLALAASACGVLCALSWWVPIPAPAAGIAGFVCLGVLPGVALVALARGGRFALEDQAAAIGLSPVLAGILLALLMVCGSSLEGATRVTTVLFAVAASAGLVAYGVRSGASPGQSPRGGEGRSELLRTWIVAAVAVALLAVFPLLGETSRMRSDAWFHSAVVSEINDFGLPPGDPYFSGMRLQYMWLYHVYVGALSCATGAEPSWAMAFVNLLALACLVPATSALALSLQRARPGAAVSSVFMLVGLNCLFWAFLPLKLARAAFGDVRGWSEISRQLSLFPLQAEKARAFVSVWKSQPFLLDKFIVATAFSLGICLSVLFLLFAYRHVASGRASDAALASCAMAGIILYHTPAAVAASGAMGLALLALALTSAPYRRRAVTLLLCMLGIGALAAPYLYFVSAAKETEQLIPVGVSALKTAAVFISCAGALLLGAPWAARFLGNREEPQYFYGLVVVASLIVSLCMVLPGPNTYDKPPYFAFLPLAPMAGWSLSAICRTQASVRRRAVVTALCVLAIAPNTVLLYAAYAADPGPARLSAGERGLYGWIAANTPRDAVFLENGDRVGMVVLGPRRLIWGHDSYAYQWGYDRKEMERRRSLRDSVFSGRPLGQEDAEELAGFAERVYVVVRSEDFPGRAAEVFEQSSFLSRQYLDSCAAVYRVETRPRE